MKTNLTQLSSIQYPLLSYPFFSFYILQIYGSNKQDNSDVSPP